MTKSNTTTNYILSEDDLARFWSKVSVDEKSGAWIWVGGCFNNGYGRFWLNGKSTGAHRVSYFLKHGPIIEGLYVCHKYEELGVNNINPDHLFLGTPKDNTQDAARKNRMAKGVDAGNSKLKNWQVLDIAKSNEPNGVLMSRYGVDRGTISIIRRGGTWSHVTGIDAEKINLSLSNKTGYTGVYLVDRKKKWRAKIGIKVNGKHTMKSLGSYHYKVDAALAYDKAAREFHGDNPKLNFPYS